MRRPPFFSFLDPERDPCYASMGKHDGEMGSSLCLHRPFICPRVDIIVHMGLGVCVFFLALVCGLVCGLHKIIVELALCGVDMDLPCPILSVGSDGW